MRLASPVAHDFGESVGVDAVEALLGEADQAHLEPQAWTLDLSTCRNVEPGAGYRLGLALRRLASSSLRVRIPEPHDFSGEWFQTFTRSGIGLALAAHAITVTPDGDDRTEQVRAYYADKGDVPNVNYGVRTAVDTGGLTPDAEIFASELERLCGLCGFKAAELTSRERGALASMTYEAVLNVGDHAFRTPWEGPPGLSYLSVRRYKAMSAKSSHQGGLRAYLARAAELASSDSQDLLGWAEFVVCDEGIGVAGRQAQDSSIYQEEIAFEDAALQEALRAGESVKLRTRDAVIVGEPGYGYTLIVDALRRLGAYAALRTGRRLVELDGTLDAPGFSLHGQILGWLPGTALHIVFPLRDSQLHLPT